MRNKSLFLLLAGICGTIAAIGVGQWMQAHNDTGTLEMVEVLVTTQAIDAEEQITPDKLRLEQWPADRIPKGASADLTKFDGRYAKQPLFEGEPMLDQKLMNELKDLVVPQGYSVVSLPAGNDGTINLVRPGDRVNIRGFFTKGQMFPRDMALDVLTGVKVYGVDGITKFEDDVKRSRSARNVQLLIRKADVEAFDFAKKLGDISISLGSPSTEDTSIPEGEASPAALAFLTDLQEYRAEQERLRKMAEAEPQVQETVAATKKPRKATFRMTKMVNGRLIEYEWADDDGLPRVVGDTGSLDSPGEDIGTDVTTPEKDLRFPSSDDYLRGTESPFFAPSSEE
ncbi:Flp pilus assembly protein CpaB [Roseiconus nitratireducens]|uniref:Flp pilus assembly protein CpaB n=1 Tax=Roseiconus nitratireducens TaxID=2605748 RepID=A0A5M6D8A6_9BACT|nr:Flp pilus assembly protein CpaB [Roseiconus nitratireducens]KAA5542109.1 Flp pilus assembly protein CpaB [Roseiconus nitratireducens]